MTTLKNIRAMIARGIARDANALTDEQLYELAEHGRKVETSAGVYGINGAIIRDDRDGELYAFAGRSVALFAVL